MCDSGRRGGGPDIASFSGVILSGEGEARCGNVPQHGTGEFSSKVSLEAAAGGTRRNFLFVNFCRIQPLLVPLFLDFFTVLQSFNHSHGRTHKKKTGNTTKRSRVSNSRTITGLSDGFNPCAIPA